MTLPEAPAPRDGIDLDHAAAATEPRIADEVPTMRAHNIAVPIVLALAAALSFAGPAAAEDSLNDMLEPLRAKYQLPSLAAAVTKNGEIIAAGAVGERVMGSGIKVTTNDRYHLGSDTKAMTATLAGMLVEAGKLRWDSTVGEILGPDLPKLRP